MSAFSRSAYNGADELVGLSRPGLVASYAYNGDGLRTSATTNGSTQQFTWDQAGSELLSDGANDYVYGPGGQVLEQVSKSTGTAFFLHTDQLGSVRLLTDASGAVVGSASYSAYGSVVSSTGTETTPFGFAGGYADPSGLVYLVHRYYDPATAEFISVDPLVGLTGQAYGYVYGDPLNVIDPLGLGCGGDPLCYGGEAAGAIGSGLGTAGGATASGATTVWNATGGKVVHAVATGTYGVCLSGSIGWGPGGTAEGCVVESHFFQHGGVTGTLGGGGQSPTAGIGIGFLSSNASSPNQLSGPFGYANGSVTLGPDIGPTVGGSAFIGNGSCNSTIVGSESSAGVGAKLPIPVGVGGGGVSYTWVRQAW